MVQMVIAGSLFSQLSWLYYTVIVLGNLVVLIAVLSMCVYCLKSRSYENDGWITLVGGHEGFSFFPSCPLYCSKGDTLVQQSQTASGTMSIPESLASLGLGLSMTNGENIQPPYEDLAHAHAHIPDSQRTCLSEDSEAIPEPPTEHFDNLGTIYFRVSYLAHDQVLKVLIQKATNIPRKDITGSSDPYVTVVLLPDKQLKLETRVRKKNLNPVWNEELAYECLSYEKLVQNILYLKVSDYDRFSRDDAIGEVRIPLSDVILQEEPVPFVKNLLPCKGACTCLGNLLISMCYGPTNNCIKVIVMKCDSLHVHVHGCAARAGLFIKVYMMYDGKKVDKKKTEVTELTPNPVWNSSMQFEVPFDKARDTSFVFNVRTFKVALPSKCIGSVIIGNRMVGTPLKHWIDMLNNPRKTITRWHALNIKC